MKTQLAILKTYCGKKLIGEMLSGHPDAERLCRMKTQFAILKTYCGKKLIGEMPSDILTPKGCVV